MKALFTVDHENRIDPDAPEAARERIRVIVGVAENADLHGTITSLGVWLVMNSRERGPQFAMRSNTVTAPSKSPHC